MQKTGCEKRQASSNFDRSHEQTVERHLVALLVKHFPALLRQRGGKSFSAALQVKPRFETVQHIRETPVIPCKQLQSDTQVASAFGSCKNHGFVSSMNWKMLLAICTWRHWTLIKQNRVEYDMAGHGGTWRNMAQRAWHNKQAIRDNGILASSLSGFLSGCQRSCKDLHCRPSATYLGATKNIKIKISKSNELDKCIEIWDWLVDVRTKFLTNCDKLPGHQVPDCFFRAFPAWELSFSLPLPCPERREGGNQSERNSKMELSERNSVGFQLPRLPNGSNHKKPRQIHAVVWQMWKIPKPHWPSTPFPASQARNISAKSSKACVWVCHGNNAHGCAWHIFAYIDSHYLFLYGLTRIFKTSVLKVCISRISNHVYL